MKWEINEVKENFIFVFLGSNTKDPCILENNEELIN